MINDLKEIWQELKKEPKEYRLRRFDYKRLLFISTIIGISYFGWNEPQALADVVLFLVGKALIVMLLLCAFILFIGILDFIFPKTK